MKREVGLIGALVIVLTAFLMFAAGRILRVDLLVLLMLVSMSVAAVFTIYYRYSWGELLDGGVIPMISRTSGVFLLMFTIGPMMALWSMSGTVPYIIWLSLKLMSTRAFLVEAFLLCCVFSLITGTSWGTVAIFGVPLMAVAHGFGVPLSHAAGAVVSGAYFGDKMSPVSVTTLMASSISDIGIDEHIKSMLVTAIPSVLLCLALYTLTGNQNAAMTKLPWVTEMLAALERNFWLNPVTLLPPMVLFYMIYRRMPSLQAFWISMLAAAALAFFQGHSLPDLLTGMGSGHDLKTGMPQLDTFLNRGGSGLMSATFGVVFFSYLFAGQLEYTGTFRVLCGALQKKFIKDNGERYVLSVSLTSLLIAFSTGVSFLGIVIPGMMYRDYGDALGVRRRVLSRTLEDSGAISVPLVPWSAAGLYIANLLGVPTETYFPWAVFCYSGILFSWIYCGFCCFFKVRKPLSSE